MTVTTEIKKIENIFDKFNEVFYNNELTRPVIVYSCDKTYSSYGWCSCDKVWYNTENEKQYEINISANTIKYEKDGGVYGTLLHEMAHLYNIGKGIKDVSNNGFYHNKKYKETAEAHGLTCKCHPTYGWTMTALNEESKAIVDEMEKLEMFYINPMKEAQSKTEEGDSEEEEEEGEKKPRQKRTWVYRCPICGEEIKSKNPDGTYYDDCGEKFERVD